MHVGPLYKYLLYMFQGNVENWLGELLKGIQSSLHSIIRISYIALQDPSMKLIEFENSYPAQVGRVRQVLLNRWLHKFTKSPKCHYRYVRVICYCRKL